MMKLIEKWFLLNDKNRNSAFDGVRGFSIILVLFFHYNQNSYKFFYGGHLGVDIFFVLSGYFIASILFNSNKSTSNYIENRFLRLMPAYSISLLIIWLLHYNLFNSYKGFVANLLFLPFFTNKIEYMNFVSWTLAWEWLFYFIAFLLFKFAKYFDIKYFYVIFILILISLFIHMFNKKLETYRFIGFYLGCLIFLLHFNLKNKYLQIISLISILAQIFMFGYFNQYMISSDFKLLYYIVFDIMVSIFLITLLCQETFLKVIFKSKLLVFLGKISYSFYLTHAMIGIYFSTIFLKNYHFNYFINAAITFIFSVIIAAIFFLITERPYFIYKSAKTNAN